MTVEVNHLSILFYPDPRLRQTARPVDPLDPQVRTAAARMIQLMHEAKGVGLAAPQVGLPWRLFITNPTGEPGNDVFFVNPVLSDPAPEQEAASEGCLSIPGITVEVRRHKRITVSALDLAGSHFQMTSEELPARIWQHETDHLDGRLIIDRMSPLDRVANRKQLKELEGRFAASSV